MNQENPKSINSLVEELQTALLNEKERHKKKKRVSLISAILFCLAITSGLILFFTTKFTTMPLILMAIGTAISFLQGFIVGSQLQVSREQLASAIRKISEIEEYRTKLTDEERSKLRELLVDATVTYRKHWVN